MSIPKPAKLVKKTLATQLAELLEETIEAGTWKVGEKIPSEPELSEIYGLSRNTLREAIHYLVITGVIDVRPGDGTYVRNRTAFDATMNKRLAAEDSANIIEVRRLIEPDICAMAAMRRTEEELEILEQKHSRLLESYEKRQSNYIDADISFHMQIAEMCHNPLLKDLYRAVINYYPLFLKDSFLSFLNNEHLEIYLHCELMACIRNKNPDAAKKLTEKMIESEASDLHMSR